MQVLERRINHVVRKITEAGREGARNLVQILNLNQGRIDNAERISKGSQYITSADRSDYRFELFLKFHGLTYPQLVHRVPTDSPLFINYAISGMDDINQQIAAIPDEEIDKSLLERAVDTLVEFGLVCRWPRK